MKNIFNIILTLCLINFSFYYTKEVSDYLKNKDPIMIKIKNNQDKYKTNPKDAIINNNTIIPGISGRIVDTNNSYLKMKKINTYNENMLIYKSILPTVSITNHQDKYIISGNKENKKISILLKTNNLDIIKKYNQNINFILTNSFIKENQDYLKNIKNNIIVNQNELINQDLISYCYNENINKKNICKDYNKFTIVPTFITHDYYYNTIKILENGKILAYNITNNNQKEIDIIISTINNLNIEIVSLDELLKE